MEKKIAVTKRFRHNTLSVYQYLLKEFSAEIAYRFLIKIEQRIQLIIKHPIIGKSSSKKENIRSIILAPHNQIFYRYKITQLKYCACLICEKIPKSSLIN